MTDCPARHRDSSLSSSILVSLLVVCLARNNLSTLRKDIQQRPAIFILPSASTLSIPPTSSYLLTFLCRIRKSTSDRLYPLSHFTPNQLQAYSPSFAIHDSDLRSYLSLESTSKQITAEALPIIPITSLHSPAVTMDHQCHFDSSHEKLCPVCKALVTERLETSDWNAPKFSYKFGLVSDIFQNRHSCNICRLLFYALPSRHLFLWNSAYIERPSKLRVLAEITSNWSSGYWSIHLEDDGGHHENFGDIGTILTVRPETIAGLSGIEYLEATKKQVSGPMRDGRTLSNTNQAPLINVPNCASLIQNSDLSPLRRIIRDCDETHPNCRHTSTTNLDILLFDVIDERLIDATSDYSFVALSYVWGCAEMLRTEQFNVLSLMKKGALSPNKTKLPHIIRDAMHIVRALCQRYLWIDCLCIVQDDERRKHDQIRNMHLIYG